MLTVGQNTELKHTEEKHLSYSFSPPLSLHFQPFLMHTYRSTCYNEAETAGRY